MYNDIDKEIMFKFLNRHYPVSRVKQNMRFKRAIILDNDSIYFLSDETSYINLRFKLMDILKKIFSSDDVTNRIVLNNFLKLK